jgi:hypothetical protein
LPTLPMPLEELDLPLPAHPGGTPVRP